MYIQRQCSLGRRCCRLKIKHYLRGKHIPPIAAAFPFPLHGHWGFTFLIKQTNCALPLRTMEDRSQIPRLFTHPLPMKAILTSQRRKINPISISARSDLSLSDALRRFGRLRMYFCQPADTTPSAPLLNLISTTRAR